MKSPWTLHIDDQWIAWLTLDVPGEKVNVLSAQVMRELDSLLDQLAGNESIKAVAVRSGKAKGFIAGADIHELATIGDAADARVKATSGQAVFSMLSLMPVPTIAVIHGACMGGGLELALACHYRLVTDDPDTKLAAPEVKLGILPGWGGTQRLPRLIGLAGALDMILTGRDVSGRSAYKMGLVDGVVAPEFLEEQTQRFINRILQSRGKREVLKRRGSARPRLMRLLEGTSPGRALIYRRARRDVQEKTHGHYPAPIETIEVIRATYRKTTLTDGMEIEADAFAKLACTDVSRNLVWLFQASKRQAKAIQAGDSAPARPMGSAAVVGAGIMGSGIAWALANAGFNVRLQDINWDAVTSGTARAADMFRALVVRRKMTEGQLNVAMHRIAGTTDYTGFQHVNVVIEAVAEDMTIKKKVLRDIESRVSADTIICTNTSSLSLEELAASLSNPRRFVGLHFFNPVNRMPLVEVVPCNATTQRTIIEAADLVRRINKTPIIVGKCAGFLVNRILIPYLVEAAWMVEEGIDAQRIDRLLEGFGMPMGPLALADEVGLDVGFKAAKVLEAAYGERMRVAMALDRVVTLGGLYGRKSGKGIYLYNNGHRKVNPDIDSLLEDARRADGITINGGLSDQQIIDRAVLIMVNEAARCIDEGVVGNVEALDVAMVLGTGFAPFRGGLLRYADARGIAAVHGRLKELAAKYGERFAPAPLIERMAAHSTAFYAKGSGRH
jgi:3-hydroxyacyl-CoA dehydrogenase/enoyl-CoA hydratase/3-hydroxybutyryl-CoA epimerase